MSRHFLVESSTRLAVASSMTTTTKKANASNLTKQLTVESAERQAMAAARRMARLVATLKARA